MKKQDYNNHIFYYWPHHFFFYGVVIAGFALCGLGIWRYEEQRALWGMMAVVIFLIVWLSYMTRQHYALGNQNRTVRLEMRLRYYILAGKRFEEIEANLSLKQIAALRFASDEELDDLIKSAIAENLNPDEIKRHIKNWQADNMRV
jgi:hypothetical protein